jgi:glycosyltransferase involved in cell wall biosynthesis
LLLDYFKFKGKTLTLLLIGEVSDEIYENYRYCENITFTGRVLYEDVPKYASQAVYGINYMPDKYPYNLQTSTKLLEYLSMGLKVITTDYSWVRNFMDVNQIQLVTVTHSLEGLDSLIKKDETKSIERINFDKYKWAHIIQQSGIEGKLLKLL